MNPWDEYAAAQPASSAKPWEEYGAAANTVNNDAISQGARSFASQGSDALGGASQAVLNALGGFVRGSGSIASTGMRLLPNFLGGDTAAENAQRRAGIDANMQAIGAQPDSWFYKGGKLGGEIAGTAGVGGVAANGIRAAARFAPSLTTYASPLAAAIETGGFRTGGLTGLPNVLTRAAGGAINGGLTAGLVNPEDAKTGAMIGGALPVAAQGVGSIAEALGSAFRTGPKPNAQMLDTARQSMDAGYVIPPSMVDPSFKNRTLESLSGKFETAQLASTRNQDVTEGLVRKALGLPQGAPLTQDAMQAFRNQQYQTGYEPVKQLGMIPAGQSFNNKLDAIAQQYTGKGTIPAIAQEKQAIMDLVDSHKSAGFDAGDAVDAIRVLRESANDAFGPGGNKALGKTYKAIANAYEGAIDDALQQTGQSDLLTAYRAARTNIAKSGTVEKAIREGAGTVDARILARELQKGKPLTGELETAAKFGNVFNKAAQPPHLIGSPGVNVLKPALSLLTGAAGGAAMGPAGVALGAANYIVPPVARSVMFSQPFQRGLLNFGAAPSNDLGLLTQGAYRVAPLLTGQ